MKVRKRETFDAEQRFPGKDVPGIKDFLQSKGFEYKKMSLSRGGGVRSYENKFLIKRLKL